MKQQISKTLLRRTSILLQLQAAHPAALAQETLLRGMKLSGAQEEGAEEETLLSDIAYLEEKGHIKSSSSEICAAHKRLGLSAKGLDYLETMGF